MDWPVSVGDEITYQVRIGPAKARTKEGKVVDLTDKLAVISLPRYRDTILKVDLITGDVKITKIIKGEDSMGSTKKLEMPAANELRELFKKADGNISRAAQMNEPPVSAATMSKWLRKAGIIPASGLKPMKEVPPADELLAAWEESKYTLSRMGKKYNVSGATVKRWLKAEGIIVETATGVQTVQPPVKTDSREGFSDKDNVPIPYTVTPEQDENKGKSDHETLKKMIDFCLAPVQGRIEKLELSLASVAQIVIGMDSSRNEMIDLLADLIVRILGRVAHAQAQRDGRVDRQKAV
jgi:hypothetical protein